jgi:hypothetical protein
MPEEERVTTYSGLVKVLRKRVASYVTEGIERARALREAVRLTDEPVEVKGRIWRGPPSGPPLWSSRTFQRQPRWESHRRSRLTSQVLRRPIRSSSIPFSTFRYNFNAIPREDQR